jgi:hypothetical protein
MFTGKLIDDLFDTVERAERSNRPLQSEGPGAPDANSVPFRAEDWTSAQRAIPPPARKDQ